MMNFESLKRMQEPPKVIGRKVKNISPDKIKNMLIRSEKILSILKDGRMCQIDIHKELKCKYETSKRDVEELEAQGKVKTFNVYMLIGFNDKGYERKTQVKVVELA